MKYDLKSFSKRLVQIIENRYLTQTELARKIKMSKTMLSLYCKGVKAASPKAIVKLCTVLDCSPDWLIKGEGSIKDTFQLSLLSNLDKEVILKKISAAKFNNMIEIRFFIPQHDFNTFIKEARRDGCFV